MWAFNQLIERKDMNSYRILIKYKHLLSPLEQELFRSLMREKEYIEANVTTDDKGIRLFDIAGVISGDDKQFRDEPTLLRHCLINFLHIQLRDRATNYGHKIYIKDDKEWEDILSIENI